MGSPGFPNVKIAPRGRVWEGEALPRIIIFIRALCGAAAWMTNVNIAPRGRVWEGEALPANNPPAGRVWEGFALPRIIIFIRALCGAAAWMTEVNIWGNRVFPRPSR